jgi:hypothetical protein
VRANLTRELDEGNTMTSNEHDRDEMPDTDELEEPSVEKAPEEEPKAPRTDESEPDHEAVGIGVIDRPQTDTEDTA